MKCCALKYNEIFVPPLVAAKVSYFFPRKSLWPTHSLVVRARDIKFGGVFIAVADSVSMRMIWKPLGYKENQRLCLGRENFSLNLLDDWCTIKTLRVKTPLEYKENQQHCLARENFSLNLLDDWGCTIKTLRVKTPLNIRSLFYHLQNEKTIAAIHYLYKKMLEHWNSESGYRTTPNGS